MSKKNISLLFLSASFFLNACNKTQTHEDKRALVSNAEMTLTIDGMMCEKGCAKTIEKTVSDLIGVTFSKVNFEEKTAIFRYDDSKTSEKEILNVIANINEGQYKISKVELKVEKKIDTDKATYEKAVEEKLMKDTAI